MAAGFLEAESGFRRIQGYRQMPFIIEALYRAAGRIPNNSINEEAV